MDLESCIQKMFDCFLMNKKLVKPLETCYNALGSYPNGEFVHYEGCIQKIGAGRNMNEENFARCLTRLCSHCRSIVLIVTLQ